MASRVAAGGKAGADGIDGEGIAVGSWLDTGPQAVATPSLASIELAEYVSKSLIGPLHGPSFR
jgi:hypothetical protein